MQNIDEKRYICPSVTYLW